TEPRAPVEFGATLPKTRSIGARWGSIGASAEMVIGLLTMLLAAAAGAVIYRRRAAAASPAPEPVEILLGPQELQKIFSPAQAPAPPQPLVPLTSPQALKRLRELALGAATTRNRGPEHAAVSAAAIAATEDAATLRQLDPAGPACCRSSYAPPTTMPRRV